MEKSKTNSENSQMSVNNYIREQYYLKNLRATPEGRLFWKRGIKNGKEIRGTFDQGYMRCWFMINGKRVYTYKHRVLYTLYHGEMPKKTVDHINQNKLDNRIENLRDVSMSVQVRNRTVSIRKGHRFKGVSQNRKGWISRCWHDNSEKYIGFYKSEEEAAQAYNDYVINNQIKNKTLNVF